MTLAACAEGAEELRSELEASDFLVDGVAAVELLARAANGESDFLNRAARLMNVLMRPLIVAVATETAVDLLLSGGHDSLHCTLLRVFWAPTAELGDIHRVVQQKQASKEEKATKLNCQP